MTAVVAGDRRTDWIGPYVVMLILIAATIPWRKDTYYSGGADWVVVTKAALSVIGVLTAWMLGHGRGTRPVPLWPAAFVALYLVVTVIGGGARGDLTESVVVASRVVLLAVGLLLLAAVHPAQRLIGCLIAALCTAGGLGIVTGIGSLADGRLRGGIPPLHPNEIASMACVLVLWCLWKIVVISDGWRHWIGVAIGLSVLVATGSRTPMATLALAALVLFLHMRWIRIRTIVVGLAALPIVGLILAGTSVVQELLFRGEGVARVTTLANRTIAWQAALAPKDSAWQQLFGGGLVMKRIEVAGQYWNTQILDSSWVSALVQGGVIGLALCVFWVLRSLVAASAEPMPVRALQLALIIFVAVRGFLESGMFDASTAFLIFFTCCVSTTVQSAAGSAVGGTRSDDVLAPVQLAGDLRR